MWAMAAKWYSCLRVTEGYAMELGLRVKDLLHKGWWQATSPCFSLRAA